jgi:hypothetical protein
MLKRWHQLWRLFLLAWLTLAIPTQGFAAATKVLCPQHQSGHGSGTQAASPHAEHAHHGGHHGGHDQANHQAHISDAHAGHHAKASQCSACGTCCAALGMPEQVLMAFQPPLVDATLPAGSPRLSLSFLTDGPERPPKAQRA